MLTLMLLAQTTLANPASLEGVELTEVWIAGPSTAASNRLEDHLYATGWGDSSASPEFLTSFTGPSLMPIEVNPRRTRVGGLVLRASWSQSPSPASPDFNGNFGLSVTTPVAAESRLVRHAEASPFDGPVLGFKAGADLSGKITLVAPSDLLDEASEPTWGDGTATLACNSCALYRGVRADGEEVLLLRSLD